MEQAHEFLKVLTVVLCVAALTTVVFQRLKQPVVLGYILAGVIVGPYVPIPLVANRHVVEILSELGVILLIFALGLEFSLRKLVQVGPTAGLTAVVQSSFMLWLGFVTGRAFGWTARESLFAGAAVAISSTTIIAKAFEEQNIRGGLRELVVGILIVEDLIAILLMAVLTALSLGDDVSAATVLESGARLGAFLVALVVLGMLLVPRAIRAIVRLRRPEMTLIASMGICFGVSLLALSLGYSVALGAFIAGSLIGESGEERQVERLVMPVRDMFAAIFFVSVGMLIDPAVIARHWQAVTVFTLVVILGKMSSVAIGALLAGKSARTSIRAGMSLSQIGEFSFIIAGLGLALGATGKFLYPVMVAVSAITTLTTPLLIRASDRVASFVDGKLPAPIHTFLALYGSWLERLRGTQDRSRRKARVKRLIKLLLLDAVLLAALVIGAAVYSDDAGRLFAERFGIDAKLARGLVIGLTVVLTAPFVVGVIRISRGLGIAVAQAALPRAEQGTLDLAAAPRRVLVVTIQLAGVLLVGLPILALVQPFVAGWAAALALAAILVLLGFVFWRNAAGLHGHVRAGAQVILEALVSQAAKGDDSSIDEVLAKIEPFLSGLGEPVAVRLPQNSSAVGKTLAALDLRGLTGATVLAIARGDHGVVIPGADDELRAGDVLALAGTHDAVAAAKDLLDAVDESPHRASGAT